MRSLQAGDLRLEERALGTMARADKGPVAPPPSLDAPFGTVADGVDFYVGEEELGHIHLDGSIHLATNPGLGEALVTRGLARPFRYVDGWIEERIQNIGVEAAIALFRYDYERLVVT